MKTIAAYSDRACVTGKAIRQKFRALRKQSQKKAKCDLFIRWGSTEEFPALKFRKELNTLEAVRRTSNKLSMMQALSAGGVPIPQFGTGDIPAENKDRDGNVYIRNKLGVVRYGNDFNPASDLYWTTPVKFKRREYRVHVFNGKILGIYEKVPHNTDPTQRPKLFKSDTCRFIKTDPEISRVDQSAQKICIDAVAALGLLFGGVDLIRNKHGEFTICEVNSAPGLNSLNIDRWVDEIKKYYLGAV